MDVFEAIAGRRSVGKLGGGVSDAIVRRLVDAAVLAPNHKLTRPWRFTLVRGAARERLGALWADIAVRESALTGAPRDDLARREAAKPLRAPAILVVSTRTHADPVVAEEDYAATAAAVQNVLLAAHALGMGAIWRTGAMARRSEINASLGLAPSDRIVAFVYLGEPAGAAPEIARPTADGVFHILE